MIDLNEIRKQKLITALLESNTREEAFDQVGISHTTGWKIMKEEDFQRDLKEASRRMYEQTMQRLSGASSKAFEVLMRSMGSSNEHVALKASIAYFQLMSNPKALHNDAELESLKRHVDGMHSAVKDLDKDAQKVFLDAYKRHTG